MHASNRWWARIAEVTSRSSIGLKWRCKFGNDQFSLARVQKGRSLKSGVAAVIQRQESPGVDNSCAATLFCEVRSSSFRRMRSADRRPVNTLNKTSVTEDYSGLFGREKHYCWCFRRRRTSTLQFVRTPLGSHLLSNNMCSVAF